MASFFIGGEIIAMSGGPQAHFCRLVRCNSEVYWEPAVWRLIELQVRQK